MEWIEIARELAALGQIGTHYALSEYDRERYARIGEIAAEMLAGAGSIGKQAFLDWNAKEFGYATPKIDVRGFVLRDDRVLLVRENLDGGRWTLPGGWADVNDRPSDAVIREIAEESGYESKVCGLLAVYDREKQGHMPPFPFHVYKLFFHCEITGGEAKANHESSESGFFPVDALPELSDSRVKREQIEQFARKVKAGDLRTDFD